MKTNLKHDDLGTCPNVELYDWTTYLMLVGLISILKFYKFAINIPKSKRMKFLEFLMNLQQMTYLIFY